MKLECNIGQGFGGNATATYKAGGLLGHAGVDNNCGFGTPIHAYQDGYVYKVLTKENPANDGSGFTGVFVLVENEIELFEMLYGHCNPLVTVGQNIKFGDVIGTEANNGEVYSNGERITLEMQKNGDQRGAHRHDQKRLLRKDKSLQSYTNYLTDNEGRFYYNGFYYAVPFYKNGFNGCVDMLLPLFNRNLSIGMSGYDVKCLQNFLKWKGFLKIDSTTDFFGTRTLNALIAFQKANNISPTKGFCGEKTRNCIVKMIE